MTHIDPALLERHGLSPDEYERIVAALADNVKKYETQFGKIEVAQAPADANEIGFAAR